MSDKISETTKSQNSPDKKEASFKKTENNFSIPPLPGQEDRVKLEEQTSVSPPTTSQDEEPKMPPPPSPPPMAVSQPPSSRKKIILASIVLFSLLVLLPITVFLVKQRQETRKRAAGCPPETCSGNTYLCAGECDCNWELNQGVRWHYNCVNGKVESYNELDSSCNYVCAQTGGGDCQPTKEYLGATKPGYDCSRGENASVSLKICLPEGCPETDVSYNKVIAFCSGEEWANCESACGGGGATESVHLSGGECKTVTASCGPPENCGSCQVDIDGYGVRKWENSGCGSPTGTPTPSPTITPSPTPKPTSTPTPTPPPSEYSTSCQTCKAYNEDWNEIKDLSSINVGQTIYLATKGSTTHPEGLTKAKFRVNAGAWQETTAKHEDMFYISYQIDSAGTYKVEAMVYNPTLGWF